MWLRVTTDDTVRRRQGLSVPSQSQGAPFLEYGVFEWMSVVWVPADVGTLGITVNQGPQGTVVFLFTDIVGSTKLWDEYGKQMGEANSTHEGHVFKTVGDAFSAAFFTASSALSAAIAVQLALRREPWPVPGGTRVRTALHVGEASQRDDD